MNSVRSFVLSLSALAVFFGAYAALELRRYPVPPLAAGSIYLALILLLVLYLAPAFNASREFCVRLIRRPHGILACTAAFLLPYLIYGAGTGDFHWRALLLLFALAAIPFGVFAFAPVRDTSRLNWQDAGILLWLFVPVVFGMIGGIWNVPVNLDFMTRVYLVAVGSWSFILIRGTKDCGYDFRFTWIRMRDAFLCVAGFAAIGLPTGFAMRFIAWNPQWRGAVQFALDYATIFLFVALAEELFFRGLLQNLLEGSFHSGRVAQAAASIVFGLSHIRHSPAPNWRYVILATIAGWFYGWAYRKHRSLLASTTTHALVDTLWRTWLTLPKA